MKVGYRECHGFMNPCRLVLQVTVGAGTGCEFATLTQPIPVTWVWQVFQHLPVSVIESHMATQYPWCGFLLPSPSSLVFKGSVQSGFWTLMGHNHNHNWLPLHPQIPGNRPNCRGLVLISLVAVDQPVSTSLIENQLGSVAGLNWSCDTISTLLYAMCKSTKPIIMNMQEAMDMRGGVSQGGWWCCWWC